MTPDYRALCKELVDSVELLLEMRAVDAKPMAITEDRVSRARALLAEAKPQPPADGEVAEVAAWLRLFCSEEYESRYLDPDVDWLTRAAELLEKHHPAPVSVIELPQGWHMLSDIEPEPGAMCDWVIMAPWGCDHGRSKWPDFNGVLPCEFFDVRVGWPVYYKGFASADGVMVSDPKLTAWRMLPLPTSKTIKD